MGKERDSLFYNEVFAKSKKYHKKWDEIPLYDQVWSKSIDILLSNNVEYVLDIGCGMGQFADICHSKGIKYKGIDFSNYAIDYCKSKSNQEFICVDVFKYDFKDNPDAYVSHEFLEHVNDDLGVFKKLKPGVLTVFSVPNHDSDGHVRFFKSIDEVHSRYSNCFEQLDVIKITKNHYLGFGTLK